MWIMSTLGFYSVVADTRDAARLIVRCRAKQDAVRMRGFIKATVRLHVKVKHTPTADYAYRLFVKRSVWDVVMLRLARDIDYSNFKNRIGQDDHERAHLYSKVWSVMLEVQRAEQRDADYFYERRLL